MFFCYYILYFMEILMKKFFILTLSATILTTNPLFAMLPSQEEQPSSISKHISQKNPKQIFESFSNLLSTVRIFQQYNATPEERKKVADEKDALHKYIENQLNGGDKEWRVQLEKYPYKDYFH